MARFKLMIDGVSMHPEYIQKIKYDPELVWSENTRRNSSALMTGKIKADKYKIEVSYKPDIPQGKLKTIRNKFREYQIQDGKKIYKEWHTVVFTDEVGEEQTKTMYFGSLSVEPYWFVDGKMLYQSINISLIER